MIHLKRASLRESLLQISTRAKRPSIKKANRLKGLYLFRAAVRLVLEFIEWFAEEPKVKEITDDARISIKITEETKVEKKVLTLQDRSVLLTRSEDRRSVEKQYIFYLFKKIHAFKKYPVNLTKHLVKTCFYQYLRPGRVIVRQDHDAENLYLIINGECSLSKIVTDHWTGERQEVDMGTMNSGDMFGEIALLHKIPRSATVVSKTTVDLLLIPRKSFDEILRDTLLAEWDVLQDALVHFNYFKNWDVKTIRECCILSRMKNFLPDEVLLGDAKGLVNYVHFVIDGECQLMEHMLVREQHGVHGVHYELYEPKDNGINQKEKVSLKKLKTSEKKLQELEYEYGATRTSELITSGYQDSEAYIQFLSKSIDKATDFECASIITTTLFDVVNEWHKITDVAEMLIREPSSISQQCYPSDVRTIFMQICTYTRGACFGLGENMLNRRIVSTTPVRCFLIPRYWLNEHNRANIWERVKLFMDSKFPTKKELFKKFVENRRWLMYKENLVDAIKHDRRIRSNVTVHDIPYSIRIINDVGM